MNDIAAPVVAHDLSHYLRPLRRHRALIALLVVLGTLAGVAGARLVRPTYTATARVQVTANLTDQVATQTGARTNGIINMDTQSQLVTTLPVADIAQRLMKTSTAPGVLVGRVTVTVPPNTTILRIAFAAHSAQVATAGANAFAQGYLEDRSNIAKAYQATQVNAVNAQLNAERQAVVQEAATANSTPPNSAAHHQAELKKSQALTVSLALSTTLGTLRGASLEAGTLASPATGGGAAPDRLRYIVILAGIVLGLLGGVTAATAREASDRSVRSADDLGRVGLPVIAEMPTTRGGLLRRRSTALTERSRVRAEQRVAAAIGAALGAQGGPVYVAQLSPALADEGFASRLADELGRFGSSTEIVTLGESYAPVEETASSVSMLDDPRRLAAAPDDEPAALTRVIGRANPQRDSSVGNQLAAARSGQLGTMRPRQAGAPLDDVSALMHEVQAALTRSRYVILVGRDSAFGSEPYILASMSLATVVVVEPGVTTRAQLADVVEQVEVTSSRVVGAFIWRRTMKRRRSSSVGAAASASPVGPVVRSNFVPVPSWNESADRLGGGTVSAATAAPEQVAPASSAGQPHQAH